MTLDIFQQRIKQLFVRSITDRDPLFLLAKDVEVGSLEGDGFHPCWRWCLLHGVEGVEDPN